MSHVAVFRDIQVLDVSPLTTGAARIKFRQLDIMIGDQSLDAYNSPSACTLWNIRIGALRRSGRRHGHVSGLRNMARMVKPAGGLYLPAPISQTQLRDFGGQRVSALPYHFKLIRAEGFDVVSSAYVDNACHLDIEVAWGADADKPFAPMFGCGILELGQPK